MSPVQISLAVPLTVAPVSPSACTTGCPARSRVTKVAGAASTEAGICTAPCTTNGQINEQFCTWLARNWVSSAPGAGCTDAVRPTSNTALRSAVPGGALTPAPAVSIADAHATARSLTL
ncbi:Uncharacterised protein [Mycobacteroides abscessus subsp. abscessus]|nr:Uncharacterised protein [Mycobacteroides abscessus subsp. abscessus]